MYRDRNGKSGPKAVTWLIGIAAVILILALAPAALNTARSATGLSIGGGTGTGTGSDVELNAATNCGDARTTQVVLNLYNIQNDTGLETFDASGIIYNADGSLFTTFTDTTEGTLSQSLVCGNEYVLRLVSADGTGGDSAQIISIRAGPGAQVIEDGRAVKFAATQPSMRLELNGKQHANAQARVYDNINAAFFTDTSGDGTTSDYELDGTDFRSTSSNATAIAVSTGGRIDSTWYLQSTLADGDFADLGMYIAVDAAPTVWDRPAVRFNGAELTDVKGSLDSKSATAMSGYEFVYFVPAPAAKALLDQRSDATMGFRMAALSGVDPGASDDIAVDFIALGASRETTGNAVRYAPYTDAASPAAVFTVVDFGLDVS